MELMKYMAWVLFYVLLGSHSWLSQGLKQKNLSKSKNTAGLFICRLCNQGLNQLWVGNTGVKKNLSVLNMHHHPSLAQQLSKTF